MKKNGITVRKVFQLIVLTGTLCSWGKTASIHIQRDVMIPMRDGVKLAANITLPNKRGNFPVILVRTPYGKDSDEDDWGTYWAENGFGFVIMDCRGTGNSEGEWYPGINEKTDGIYTRSWILRQKWCNGNIGTTGGSYLGFTQFVSSTESTESLKAMFPIIPLIDWFNGGTYINGALSLGTAMGWGLSMARPSEGEDALIDEDKWDWEKAFRKLPLIDFDKNIGIKLPWMRNWVKHPSYSDYWHGISLADVEKKCKIPLVTVSGWYDVFLNQVLKYHSDAINKGKKNQYLIVGPWGHGPNYSAGERKFGENSKLDLEALQLKWFNHWLKGEKVNLGLPPVKIYVMGKNYWRNENEFPLKRTKYVNYYLNSNRDANSLSGDGTLSQQIPSEESSDTFVYDPENPVPTKGGSILFYEYGAFDQKKIEGRDDILVFTSESMKEELEITGWVKMIIYAATDSKDTDWTAKLVDVYPDGRAFNLCDGIIRARYRKNLFKPELITPNRIYKYEIDLWATSNVFLPGHKIRVEISSSNFPRFDRNPNTGNKFGMDDKMKTARQTVYHGAEYPSHIILPVIPNDK